MADETMARNQTSPGTAVPDRPNFVVAKEGVVWRTINQVFRERINRETEEDVLDRRRGTDWLSEMTKEC